MARIVLLQCELEHRHQSPHLAMCLYASDLEDRGHQVDCALVHPTALDDAIGEYSDRCDLLVLDSIFPFPLVRQLSDQMDVTTIVGGHNALQHALRGAADISVVGPGRAALLALARAFDEGRELRGLPGTWFRTESGLIDCGPELPRARLHDEVLPFVPRMSWDYFGPPRAPGSNLRIPSVVAEFGCVYNRSALSDGTFYRDTLPRLPELPLSDNAAQAIQAQFVGAEGGCTFCTLRYMPNTTSAEAISLLMVQARTLLTMGARGLSLQTEHPLPYLPGFLAALASETELAQRCEELHIRTIPWLLLRNVDALEEAISSCARLGIQLHLGQVGFEAFDDQGLEIFHKGINADDNRRAARLLGELTEAHAGTFSGIDGHGLILLHPWSSATSLRANLNALTADAPWLLPSVRPESRIELYCEWTPLFWKAWDEGLIKEAPERFGWDFGFADPLCAELVAVWSSILAGITEARRGESAMILSGVLDCVEEHAEPEQRRSAYLRLRDQIRRS